MKGVRFILGRSGSGKTTTIVQEITALLERDPLGEPIFLLVPDQATLLYERLVATQVATGGYLRLGVITFRAMTELLLKEAGGEAVPEVTALGRRILIGRLLRRLQPQLQFYRSSARQPGLADRLDEAFAEVERAGLNGDDLERLADDLVAASPDSALIGKLRDLRLLMAEYDLLLGGARLDQHRRLQHALDAAAQSPTLSRARIYVDSFDELTHAEQQLLTRAAAAGAEVTIALAMNPADANASALFSPLDDDHPFRAATHTYRRLLRHLRESGQSSAVVRFDGAPRFRPGGALARLNDVFLKSRAVASTASAEELKLIEAPDAHAEVGAAARQIVDWLRAGLRMRDILVLARNVDDYAREIGTAFDEHHIAHFIDRRQPASHHPLIRTLRSLVQTALTDWRPDAVAELAKSGLVGISDDDCDALESYLIAHHIRGGEAWKLEWAFIRRRAEDDEAARSIRADARRVNAARVHLCRGLAPLLQCDDAHTCTAAQWCQRTCESLEKLGVNAALSELIHQRDVSGDVAEGNQHREVWTELVELLDQLAEVLGDEPLNLREFAEVVDIALERFVFSVAPSTVDQVLVGSVDRTRAGPVKACIVLGLSEGVFPRRQSDARVLSDDDRRLFGAHAAALRPGTRVAQFDEQLFAYQAFSAASERLVVTRPTSDADGRKLAPSLFWQQLRAIFPANEPEVIDGEPCAPCVATPRDLSLAVLHWTRDPLHALAEGATAAGLIAYEQASTLKMVTQLRLAIGRARTYGNEAHLSSATAAKLYPSPLRTSATRLETFAACPFKHFAQHALKLAPREEVRLTPMDLGNVYHRVLDRLVRGAIHARHDFAKPMTNLSAELTRLGEEAANELRSEVLLSPGRQDHLLSGVRRTLEDVVETQRLALSMGTFRPAGTEFEFGLKSDGAPPLEIATPAGRLIALRGKIDRVDTVEIADELAATVIDYKLGKRQANFNQIYFGLSLQLVTYLIALSALGKRISGKEVEPAAAFYVRLLRGIESVDHPSDAADAGTDAFHLTTPNKPRGVIDEHFIDGIDYVTTTGASKAYALRRTEEPVDLNRNDVLEHDAFDALLTWTRGKIAAIGDEIMGGNVSVLPYRLRTLTACATCDFKAVCRFEVSANGYHWIDSKKSNERLAQIVTETRS